MSATATDVNHDSPGRIESLYVAPSDISPDTIASGLHALLSTRMYPIARHRFTVLDTFDGRIRRAGACLIRVGGKNASTVTWFPSGRSGRLVARSKDPVNFEWDLPHGPLRQALAPVIGVRRLLPQADAQEYGSLLDVVDKRGKTVARIRIESGQARPATDPGAGWRPLPTVVTLTGMRGYRDEYERLVPVLKSRPGVKAATEGLHRAIVRQFGGAERANPPDGEGVELSADVGADAGARQIHLALLRVLTTNELGIRANIDSEFLHDFRVAVRRTRSLLRQIRHVFRPDAVDHFSAEFSWLGRATGAVRDLDVLVMALRRAEPEFSAADIGAVLGFLSATQRDEHWRMVETLDSDRYRRLLLEWKTFLETPGAISAESGASERRLVDAVSARAWKLSRRIAACARTVDGRTAPSTLHEIRIDAKKLRYLVDATPGFYDPAGLQCVLAALKRLQRVLGDFNDAYVQEGRLVECGRAMGAAGGHADVLIALGRLAERTCRRREALRPEVIEHLTRFRAKEIRCACRRAFKQPQRERAS